MSSLNKCMIIGNLGQDPEIRSTQSGKKVATLSVATSERWKDKNGNQQESTEWHRCIAWDRTAEIAEEYLNKGSKVYIEGPIQTRSYEDKDGITRYSTEITVRQLTMLDSRGSSQGSLDSSNRSEKPNSSPVHDAVDMDDLPF